MNMTDDVTAQLVGIFHKTYKDLEPDAREAIVDKIAMRVNRLSAERDGWRAVATELLKIAFGDDNVLGDVEHPPLELIELREVGKLPATFVPALAQFWADLTAKHDAQRRRGLFRFSNEDERVQELLQELFYGLTNGGARIEDVRRDIDADGSDLVTLAIRRGRRR